MCQPDRSPQSAKNVPLSLLASPECLDPLGPLMSRLCTHNPSTTFLSADSRSRATYAYSLGGACSICRFTTSPSRKVIVDDQVSNWAVRDGWKE